MKYPFTNSRGQVVGEFDYNNKVYTSRRSKLKGEIFCKKNWFDGKYIELPISIDKSILDKLIQMGCEQIVIIISGLKEEPYLISVTPHYIVSNGVTINYDKRDKQGKNYTGFGEQIVFEIKGKEADLEQTRLCVR